MVDQRRPETEGFIVAIQDQVIKINSKQQFIMKYKNGTTKKDHQEN